MYKLVAVYGSLRKGLHNHVCLGDSEFIGEFVTEPIFSLFDLGSYPGLKQDGDTAITMEVYRVDEQIANRVDRLEGYREGDNNTFYDRITIDTPFGEAHTYIYVPKTYIEDLVESGDWKEYLKLLKPSYCEY